MKAWMNYLRLLRKGLRLLLNNRNLFFTVILFSVIFYSCGGKKGGENEGNKKIDFENPQVVLQQAKNVSGNNVEFAYKGKFDDDSNIEIAAGLEVQNSKEWGIKFEMGDKIIILPTTLTEESDSFIHAVLTDGNYSSRIHDGNVFKPLTVFLVFTFALFSVGLLATSYIGGHWVQYGFGN